MEDFVWDSEQEGYLAFELEENLELDDVPENRVTLAGLLIADHEPPLAVVKEVLRAAWCNMGYVRVVKSKSNLYAITVEDEEVADRIMSGNPWLVKGHTLSVKQWPLHCSAEDIDTNRAIYWVQIHGLPRNLCTVGNGRTLGQRLGSVLEVEDPRETGFRGFLRVKVDFNASRPLQPGFTVPCVEKGKRLIRLKYEGLKDYCFKCGRLGHTRGCNGRPNPKFAEEGLYYGDDLKAAPVSRRTTALFDEPSRRRMNPVVTYDGSRRKETISSWAKERTEFSSGNSKFSGECTGQSSGQGQVSDERTPVTVENSTSDIFLNSSELPVRAQQNPREARSKDSRVEEKREATRDDWVNLWNPNSYGTHYRNGTITVALKGISLERNWYDQVRVPPWALQNADALLNTNWALEAQNSEKELGCKNIRIEEVEKEVSSQNDRDSKKGKWIEYNPGEHVRKKPKVSVSPLRGRPLRLSNQSSRGRGKDLVGGSGRGRGGRKTSNYPAKPLINQDSLCEVKVSPSKALREVEEQLKESKRKCRSNIIREKKTTGPVEGSSTGGGGWPTTAARLS